MSESQSTLHDPEDRYKAIMKGESKFPENLRLPAKPLKPEVIEKREREDFYNKNISRLLQTGQIEDMVIILIDFNVYAVDNNGRHIPAEVALLAFSLKQGIIDEIGTLIDPGEIPLGLNCEVATVVDDLYLPVPPFDSDPQVRKTKALLNTMVRFINKYTNNLSPGYLFCRSEKINVVSSCLLWIINEVALYHAFEVYPLEHLLIQMYQLQTPIAESEEDSLSEDVIPSMADVNRKLNSLVLAGNSHFGCFHHMRNLDVVHKCSLAKLNRYAYYAIGFLLPKFNVSAKPCTHFHQEKTTERETTLRYQMLSSWGIKDVEYPSFRVPKQRKANKVIDTVYSAVRYKVGEYPEAWNAPLFRKEKPLPQYEIVIPANEEIDI